MDIGSQGSGFDMCLTKNLTTETQRYGENLHLRHSDESRNPESLDTESHWIPCQARNDGVDINLRQ